VEQLRAGETAAESAALDGPLALARESHAIETQHWGQMTIPGDALDDLASFTGRSKQECLARLASYTQRELADAWRAARPSTPGEMRAFYAATDAYIWELTLWHASTAYAPYLAALEKLARMQGIGHRALDYGCGIGTAAIRLAERGYGVTIADVPGVTLAYACHRLHRREIPFEAIEISGDEPVLVDRYDAIVCFDVLEHVPEPDRVFRQLDRHLARNGLISVVASFDAQDAHYEGYHLRENYLRWGEGRWGLFLSGKGYRWLGNTVYSRAQGLNKWARFLQYHLWLLTGLDVRPGGIRVRSRRISA
jgi:SAM-dependent methyltransferase